MYAAQAQHLNQVLWSVKVDPNNQAGNSHFGAPIITPSNTIIVPVVEIISNQPTYFLEAIEGGTGRLKYSLTNDYRVFFGSNTFVWLPVYQPVLATPPSGLRLYYPGAGGTVYYMENPDADLPHVPVQQCFYTNIDAYASGASTYTNIFICTPLTADTNGTIYFGFRILGTAASPISTNGGGFARLDCDGNGSYVLASVAAGYASAGSSPFNCAPALSNDGLTLYVVTQGGPYLVGLDTTTLATRYTRKLVSPSPYAAVVSDDSTASPMVGPDGDVFMGVTIGSSSSGYLLHYSADLGTVKIPGGFGWDNTAAVVPSIVVPSYHGPSSYLLFSKYNDYEHHNRVALLDPGVGQNDTNRVIRDMREVMTVHGCTPTSSFAVTEWCVNTAASCPSASCVFAPNEDGRLYRWDLVKNSLTECIILNGGIGEPYVPTVVGPDGTIYTIVGGTLFATGQPSNLDLTLSSSSPDLTSVVAGQSVTFTAIATNRIPSDPLPTGTVTFQDVSYQVTTRVTNLLATSVVLSNGLACVTVPALSSNVGSHFVSALYSGDGMFPAANATLFQKVHARASITTVTSTVPVPGSNSVKFTAAVTSPQAFTTSPNGGMVSFWDGTNFLGQAGIFGVGASVVITNLGVGSHAVSARYYSDNFFAASTGSIMATPPKWKTIKILADRSLQLTFTNASGAHYSVLGSTDLSLAASNWNLLGPAIEVTPGQFQFTDPQVVSNNVMRYYRVRSP